MVRIYCSSLKLCCAFYLLLFIIVFINGCTYYQPSNLNNQLPDNWCAVGVKGINMAGAAFASQHVPGKHNRHYFFLSERQTRYYQTKGFNTIRFSVLWERLQPELNDNLDYYYLSGIKDALMIAERQGLWLILDLHNYGRYRKQKLGSEGAPISAFADTWLRLADELKEYPALLGYGLMNEPHGLGNAWPVGAQAAVNAIRTVDQDHYIIVSGEKWGNATAFPKLHPKPFIDDPAERVVYEAHVYFDRYYSGVYRNGFDVESMDKRITRVTPFLDWLSKFNQTGFIGEFGVPGDDPRWLLVLNRFMNKLYRACQKTLQPLK